MSQKTLGVLVGRFQASYLHDGYIELFDVVDHLCDDILVCIGTTPGTSCIYNPLDYETRKIMLSDEYPHYTYANIIDKHCDQIWSDQLDLIIQSTYPSHDVTLFSSRDGFLDHYKGNHKKQFVKMKSDISSSIIRKNIVDAPYQHVKDHESFRIGNIHAMSKLFPTSYQTVDIAIIKNMKSDCEVFLGKKLDEKLWRFPGGFVDPTDESLEFAVRREVKEELGDIEVSTPAYIGSYRIQDYRYRKSSNKIMTAFFMSEYVYGPMKAGDDLNICCSIPIDNLGVDDFEECHRDLFMELKKYIYEKELRKDI